MNSSPANFGAAPLQLGKYRLIIELAQGGMGFVYLAVASGPAGFNKLVVIKELKPSLLEEPGFLEMFLDEARLAARLSHPNVVQTNEVGVEQGRAFLAMEYLDGQSYNRVRSRLLKRHSLSLAAEVRIVAMACAGLHYAHELRDFDGRPLNVVHRDVSPHNIFVTYDGQVKIVDFGVAKALSSNHESTVGVLKGKVPYMAPEQVTGTSIDRRCDIFALGVILWEAVAGKRIWAQLRTETIIARMMSGDIPRLSEAAPHADPRLAAIIERAMAVRPDDRYPTAAHLQRDLEQWLLAPDGGRDVDFRAVPLVGSEMTQAFASERAQINTSVTDQLRLLASGSAPPTSYDSQGPSIGIVRMPPFMATGSHASLSVAQAQGHVSASGSAPALVVIHQGSGSHSGLTPSVAEKIVDYSSNATVNMAVSGPSSLRVAPPPAPAPSRMGPVVALLVFVFVVSGALGIFLIRPHSKTDAEVTATPATTTQAAADSTGSAGGLPTTAATTTPEPEATIELTIHVSPPNARVYIDNAALPKTAATASFKKDGLTHRVRAEAPGFVARTELVPFTQNTDVNLQLDRVGVPPAPPPPVAANPRPATRQDPPKPDPTKPDTPSKPGRPVRPIDTNLDPQ